MERTGVPNLAGYDHIRVHWAPRHEDDLYPWVRDDKGTRWHRADIRETTPEPKAQEG